MLIDWFTVGAQVLNFVALVWLMKRFLYQPVLNAIAAREKRIADQIADAVAQQAKAATERKTFEDKNTAFDEQRAHLLDKATAQADALAKRLSERAQAAGDQATAQREKALAHQAEHLQQLIAGRAATEVMAVARKTLADLANAGLEERMVEIFTQRLVELPEPASQTLGAALKASTEPALVRSRFDMPADQQAVVRKAINLAFSADVPLRFETAADTVCGIELSAGGQKFAWTIAEYLRDLEQEVAALLVPAATPAPALQGPAPANLDSPKPDPSPAPHTGPVVA